MPMSTPATASGLQTAAASSGNANTSAKNEHSTGAAALYPHQIRTGFVRVASTPMRIRVSSSLIIPGRLRDANEPLCHSFWAPNCCCIQQ
ncbi:unnamed protein product [Prorocentrum cordatum]|uniref:Uncharacterized protein n=1 Tax=Prorocentrum cordatum TaxID=2364126 RepID=A0ABN9QI51_9DINO|nr:unnamed protein product [Polarella glacialis]